ncbi:MAG: hypothetical protein KDA47_21650, partial [Planctomycetales bacterium]|nr:hypothetical protein [Planctomycetales bacterium]
MMLDGRVWKNKTNVTASMRGARQWAAGFPLGKWEEDGPLVRARCRSRDALGAGLATSPKLRTA